LEPDVTGRTCAPSDVDRPHIDDALQAELGAQGGGGDAVHAGASLGDDARLAHAARQHDLAQHIVHLVSAGVIEVLALEVDFRAERGGFAFAAIFGQALGKIERRGAAHIVGEMEFHLAAEGGIGFGLRVGLLQLEDQRHQGLGHEPAPIDAEMPALVGTGAEGVGLLH
jgi:hypothetical protein